MTYDAALGRTGDFFFHYTTREAAFEHILPKNELRLSPAVRMRDPLEANPALLSASFFVPDDPRADAEIQTAIMAANREIEQLRRGSKVLSLTIDADGPEYVWDAEGFGRGYARPRMWEQYSENHAGVCLIFKRDEFETLVRKQLSERAPQVWFRRVSYTPSGVAAAAHTMLPSPGASGHEVAQQHMEQHAETLFFTKLKDWESEHEYRFVEASTDEKYTTVDIGQTLDGVMVGCRFPDWQNEAARHVCHKHGAKLWKLRWEMNRPWPVMIKPRSG